MHETFCGMRTLREWNFGAVLKDQVAHERGINNEATADGLMTLLSALRGDFLRSESKEQAIRILLNNDSTR